MGRTHKGTGFQNTQTSMAAALLTEGRSPTLRDRVWDYLSNCARPQTAEDVADALRAPECSIKPRLTELKDRGRIEDSGQRGKTRWGKACIMWRVIPKVPAE